jgi:hypothetical protein
MAGLSDVLRNFRISDKLMFRTKKSPKKQSANLLSKTIEKPVKTTIISPEKDPRKIIPVLE